MLQTWMNLEGIPSSGVKPDTKRQILYESTYMRYLKQQAREGEWWLSGAGGRGNGEFVMGMQFQFAS